MPAHDSSPEDHAPPPTPQPTASLSAPAGHDSGTLDDGVNRPAVAAASDAPPSPAPAPLTVGCYEVLDVLGRGGMGVVYRARHRQLGHAVALKMILAGGHADAHELARFRLEAAAVARLKHPGIVHIHDFGEHDGSPYFALELAEGGSLAGRLKQGP